ncbi:dioxygenase [Streptomyces sp. NPDC096033]|uniref:dioxygenase family protein n=1 Tax=Streptomyces sp. NPDC096033 TaxID=3366071 RepID=UPI0037F8A445
MNTASGTMPAVFVGHGGPMNAIESNEWTRGWAEPARSMPRPRAILAVSAHWYVPGVRVTADERPRTIHDFGGFPPALYTWWPLVLMYPERLRPLRDEGVLILGSGNVVHNLHTYAWGLTRDELFDWGVRFNQRIREAVPAGRVDELIDYEECGQDGQVSVPTPEHCLPFLYVIAQCRHDEGGTEPVAFPVDGHDGGGSISMLSVRIG